MSSYSRHGKKQNNVGLNTLGMSAGVALVLGIYLIDLMMKAPALG